MPLSKAKQKEWMREYRRRNRYNVIPTTPVIPTVIPSKSNSVVEKLKAVGLTGIMSTAKPISVQPACNLPLYDPSKHKPGDRVLVKPPYGKRLVPITIPELDLDGNPIPIW